jgi:hypothetical protein
MTSTVITDAMVKKALAVYRDNHGWIVECRMERALEAVAPMILEEAAKVAEAPTDKPARCREDIADAIRALKGGE